MFYQFICVIFLTLSLFSCSSNKIQNYQGCLNHSYKSGKMQCLSQINPEGYVVILLKSLEANTEIRFERVGKDNEGNYIVNGLMRVTSDQSYCALWLDIQPVYFGIDPAPVDAFTLEGEKVFANDEVTVLISN